MSATATAAVTLRGREVFSYGLADFAQTAAVQFTSMYLLFFYTDMLAVGAGVVGTIFVFSRLWDAINDPLMGMLVDHTHTRFGRCRPYLMPGSVVLCLALVMAFSEVALQGWMLLLYVVLSYNLFNMAYTATNLPVTAQLPLMTTCPRERVRLSATRAFSQSLAYALLPLAAEAVLQSSGGHRDASAYTFIAALLGVMCIVTFVIAFLLIKERVDTSPQRLTRSDIVAVFTCQWDWLILLGVNVLVSLALISRVSAGIYYFTYVVGDMTWFGTFMTLSTLAMVPCSIAASRLAHRMSKETFAIAGCVVGLVGNLLIVIAPTSVPLLLIGGTLGGCAVGAFISVLFAMEGDVADKVLSATGIQAQGLVCAMVALGYKVALGLGAGTVGALLGGAGYVAEAAVQADSVLTAIQIAFAWVPLIAVLFGVVLLMAYPRTEPTTAIR